MDGNAFSFEREWPETAQRLTLALRRRRIPHVLIDDLVQETGLRLYERWDAVDPERGAWPLAFTVAMNILKDHLRSEIRRRALTPPRGIPAEGWSHVGDDNPPRRTGDPEVSCAPG